MLDDRKRGSHGPADPDSPYVTHILVPQPIYMAHPPRRRGGVALLVGIIVIVCVAVALNLFLHQLSPTDTTITAGQIKLVQSVTYAQQTFHVSKHQTETAILFSAGQTVTCDGFVEVGINYDQSPAKLVFGTDPNSKAVAITVVTPTFLNYGITNVQVHNDPGIFAVDDWVTQGLTNACRDEIFKQAHTTALVSKATQHARDVIMQNTLAYGYTATVNFVDPIH